jgi:Protein of unknown function (DUF3054)
VTTTQRLGNPNYIRRIVSLAVGDTVAFLVFATIGRSSHAEAAGLNAIPQIIETAAPFLLGWVIAAPLLGAYRVQATSTPKTMLIRTLLAWLVAWPIGLGLRALIRQSDIPLSFALVTFVAVLVILGLWRGIFSLIEGRKSQ